MMTGAGTGSLCGAYTRTPRKVYTDSTLAGWEELAPADLPHDVVDLACVHGRRVRPVVVEIVVEAQRRREPFEDAAHAFRHRLAHIGVERAYRPLHLRLVGDDVERRSAHELPDGHDRGVLRRDLARDDRLQHRYDVGTRRDRIDRELRHRAVTALAADRQVELVGRGEERTVAHADLADVDRT